MLLIFCVFAQIPGDQNVKGQEDPDNEVIEFDIRGWEKTKLTDQVKDLV